PKTGVVSPVAVRIAFQQCQAAASRLNLGKQAEGARVIRRVGLISVLASIAVIALAVPNGAAAAVNVGQTFTPSEPDSCGGVAEEGEQVQTNRADGTSYAAPSAGVLTSWSFQAGAQITLLTLRVFHPTGIADHYLVVADADPQPQIVFDSSGLQTFP